MSPTTRLLILFICVVVLRTAGFFFSPTHEVDGDLAASMLQVDEAAHGRELLGPYSRFGFHHPGPVSFYLWAAADVLFPFLPTTEARAYFAQLVLTLVSLALVVRLLASTPLASRAGPAVAAYLALTLVVAHGGSGRGWMSLWGPHLIVAPTLVFLVAAAAVLRGVERDRRLGLIAASVAAVFVVHNHLITVIHVAPIAIAMFVVAVRRAFGVDGGRARADIAWALVVVLIGVAPLVIEEVQSARGNLSAILEFSSQASWAAHAPAEAVRILTWSFVRGLDLVLRWSQVPMDLMRTPVPAIWSGLIVIGALGTAWRRPAWRPLVTLALLTLILSGIAALRVTGPLHPYLFHFLQAPVAILGLAAVAPWCADRRIPRGVPILAGTALLALALLRPVPPPPAPRLQTLATTIAATIAERVPQRRVELHLEAGGEDHDLWADLVGLTLALRREGWTTHTPAGWSVLIAATDTLPRVSEVPLVHLFRRAKGDPNVPVLRAGELKAVIFERASPADRDRTLEVWQSAGLTPIDVGTRIGAGHPDLQFTRFHVPEDGYRWSRGHGSALLFRLRPEDVPRNDREIIFEVGAAGRQDIVLTLNEAVLDTLSLEGFGPHVRTVTVPADAWNREGPQVVGIEAPHARSVPPGYGRVLGMQITGFTISHR